MQGSNQCLQLLENKVVSCEGRMALAKDRVTRERSSMKKSLRSGIKDLRDALNQKQNELMEIIRLDEEAKLGRVANVAQQLNGLRKELTESAKAAEAIKMVKEDCPLLIASTNALQDRTKAVSSVLDGLDSEIALLPEMAAQQFALNDGPMRDTIGALRLEKRIAN